MKNKQKTPPIIAIDGDCVVLVAAVGYMFYNPQVVEVPVEVAVPVPVRPVPTRRGHTQLVVVTPKNPNLGVHPLNNTSLVTCNRWV